MNKYHFVLVKKMVAMLMVRFRQVYQIVYLVIKC